LTLPGPLCWLKSWQKRVDLTPQIAARAYELYQERVRGESQADQDWHEAEREIRQGQVEHVKANARLIS
jgi:hypothetical protein